MSGLNMEPGFDVIGAGTIRIAAGAPAPSAGIFIPNAALSVSPTKGAESVLVAILLNLQQGLTDAGFAANINQSITVKPGYSSFVVRGQSQYRQDQIVVGMAKLDSGGTINPDDYSS